MPGSLEVLDSILTSIDGGSLTAAEAMEQLLMAQVGLRNNRRLQVAMRSSRLPAIKTLQDFDFTFQPSLRREQMESLHELGFVERRENVVLLGPPGVGNPEWARRIWPSVWQSLQLRVGGGSTTAPSPI